VAKNRGRWTSFGLLLLSSLVASACGVPPSRNSTRESTAIAAPLTSASDTTNAGRASFYAAEVARYRDIASRERQASAAYAGRTAPAATAKDWNATLKVSADARAVAADQIATRIQTFADYHAAEAAKEVAR